MEKFTKIKTLTMKKILPLLFFLLISAGIYSQGVMTTFQDWQGINGVQNGIYKSKIVTDNSKNVYVAGATMNGATTDILLVKYNSSGAQLWTAQYDGGGNGEDVATGLCVDSSGNVYITGYATGTAMSPTNVDMVTIKYNNSGVQQWLTAYNGTGNAYDYGADITVDNNGNVYVTGKSYNASANVNTDIIIIKYDPIGTQQWVTRYDHTTQLNDEGVKISVRNNSVVVSGLVQTNGTAYKRAVFSYEDATGVQTGAIINSTSSSGADLVNDMVQDSLGNIYIAGSIPVAGQGYDYSILKLNPNLGIEWLSAYSGNSNLDDIAKAIQIDTLGNVYVTGYTTSSTEGRNFATVKYSNSGTQQWIQAYNDTLNGDDEANALVLDSAANVYVTGYTTTNNNHTDYYIMKYNSSGTQQWAMAGDGDAHLDDKATGIAIDNKGAVTITGQSALTTTTYQYLTNKYSEKSIITPTDYNNETAAGNFLFYKNSGQLVNTSNQAIPNVKFYTNNTSPQYYINNNSYSFVFAHVDTVASTQDTLHRIDLTFDGINANNNGNIYPLEEEKYGFLNYFLPQCPNGITEVNGNQRLLTPNLYSNIDLEYSSNQNGAKYYFIVKPGGNPANIQLNYTGASSFNLDGNTNALTINSGIGSITYDRPTVYQLSATNTIIPITGWTADWVQNAANNKYKFNIATYDSTKTLVIEVDQGNMLEPMHINTPEWSMYFGGNGYDEGTDVTIDTDGNSYFCGFTNSTSNFPFTTGAFQTTNSGQFDVFIAKFGSVNGATQGVVQNADKRLWTTYFGGSIDEKSYGITTIGNGTTGRVFITGYTESANFPTFNNAGFYHQNSLSGTRDAFIIGLDNQFGGAASQNLWSSYYGGNGNENSYSITKDVSGNIYMVGNTSTSFYTSSICVIPTDSGFPSCNISSTFNNGGSYGGGTTDAFVARFNPSGQLQWSSFYGGDNDDVINDITFDNNGILYITGQTASTLGFPITSFGNYNQSSFGTGIYDAFIARFNSSLTHQWCSYFGGNGDDAGLALTIDANNNVYMAGETSSSISACTTSCLCTVPVIGEFPLCPQSGSYFQGTGNTGVYGGGMADGFIAKFNPSLNFVWGTYYGGNNADRINGLDVDYQNKIYFTGQTFSSAPIATLTQYGPNSWDYNQSYLDGPSEGFLGYFDAANARIWSSYYGDGNMSETSNAIAVYATSATNHYWYITGATNSNDFHTFANNSISNPIYCCPNAYVQWTNSGSTDAYMTRFSINGHFMAAVEDISSTGLNASVFPNPASYSITVQFSLEQSENILIEIFSLTGQLIKTIPAGKHFGSFTHTIDFSDFSNGIYLLKIKTDKHVVTKKIIKQN